jgi:hypothetical protein
MSSDADIQEKLRIEAIGEVELVYSVNQVAKELGISNIKVMEVLLKEVENKALEVYKIGDEGEPEFITLPLEDILKEYLNLNYRVFLSWNR